MNLIEVWVGLVRQGQIKRCPICGSLAHIQCSYWRSIWALIFTYGAGAGYQLAQVTVHLPQELLALVPQSTAHAGQPADIKESHEGVVEEEREEASSLGLIWETQQDNQRHTTSIATNTPLMGTRKSFFINKSLFPTFYHRQDINWPVLKIPKLLQIEQALWKYSRAGQWQYPSTPLLPAKTGNQYTENSTLFLTMV